MAIIRRDNQYRGVNAHLHSHFQHDTTNAWGEFHNSYLFLAATALNEELPPRYRVRYERSMQIREYHPTTGERIRRPVPDISVIDREPGRIAPASGGGVVAPSIDVDIAETMVEADEEYYRALVIRDGESNQVITRIELLSPTNKPPGEGAAQYIAKRGSALTHGTALLEIDLLHESRSPNPVVPPYPDHPLAYPYSISISNPRQGRAQVYGFRVDDPIPVLPIPLADGESLLFNFGAAYDATFRSLASFYEAVDYAAPPVSVERYAELDRERIGAVQARVSAEE
jgi:hypothetical protein